MYRPRIVSQVFVQVGEDLADHIVRTFRLSLAAKLLAVEWTKVVMTCSGEIVNGLGDWRADDPWL